MQKTDITENMMLAVIVCHLLPLDQPDAAYKLACLIHAHPPADEQTRRQAAETLAALDSEISTNEREILRQQAEHASLTDSGVGCSWMR